MPATAPAIRKHEQQARDWLVRLNSGHISEADMQRFLAWTEADPAHRSAFERQRQLWLALEQVGDTLHAPPTAAANLPSACLSVAYRPRRHRLAALGIAAALLLALGMPSLRLAVQADHRTAAATQALTLDDGTQVWLDADSAIALHYGPETRRIALLRGRAWFDVADPDAPRPFVVTTPGGEVRDIGTSFQVALEDELTLAAVSHGRVELRGSRHVQLQAGQQGGYRHDGSLLPLQAYPIDSIATWRHGEILLDNASPGSAIREVARYRSGPVWVVGSLNKSETITAVFRTEHPDEALSVIAKRLNLQERQLLGGILLLHPRND